MDFIHITLIDIIDIVCVALIMYFLNKLTRGTNAPNIFLGILIFYFADLVARWLDMELLSMILNAIIDVGVIALIVIFQPEIRNFLHVVGTSSKRGQGTLFGRIFETGEEKKETVGIIEPLVEACKQMAQTRTGALIVIQRKSDLRTYAATGVAMDAVLSTPLLCNIFFPNSPLHDGAVIVSHGRIESAKCMLPPTQTEQPIGYGMRHRAAIGVSEETDAFVVVVSEETGGISCVSEGTIRSGLDFYGLRSELELTFEEPEEN